VPALPSRCEGMSRVLIEAISAGAPVGHEIAHTYWTEQVYVDQFIRMAELTLRGYA
jgi:hypothetical protein